jgi:transposase InsO family protein
MVGPLGPGDDRDPQLLPSGTRHGLVGSMGRVGAAGDNAAMESFFTLLQKNVLDRRIWARSATASCS